MSTATTPTTTTLTNNGVHINNDTLFDWKLFWSLPASKTLPVECLEQIVRHVNHPCDLYSLLTVNKSMFDIACRVLYRDPCWYMSCASNSFKYTMYDKLFDFFLTHTTVDDETTKLWRKARGVQKLSGKPFADYLSMIRVVDLHSCTQITRIAVPGHSSYQTLVKTLEMNHIAVMHTTVHVYVRSACHDHLSGIHKIHIYAEHIRDYMDAIPSMTCLQHVVFDFDGYFLSDIFNALSHYLSALCFVQAFVAHHGPGKLRAAQIVNADDRFSTDPACMAVNARMQSNVDPPVLSLVDISNWPSCVVHVDEFDWSKVIQLHLTRGGLDCWEELSRRRPDLNQSLVLQRCRSLESFSSYITNPDLFKWAVAEKNRQLDSQDEVSLVPLKTAVLYVGCRAMNSVVQDLVQAFNRTLEECEVSYRHPLEPGTPLALGSGWDLPTLKSLAISTVLPIVVHVGAFSACPVLTRLDLRSSYLGLLTDDDFHIGSIWYLPSLEKLALYGVIADKFNPQSLANMPLLNDLTLGGYPVSGAFPNYKVPQSGPRYGQVSSLWTWDWRMPALKRILLNGHHAQRFKFGALLHCPSLGFLSMNVGGHCVHIPNDLGLGELQGKTVENVVSLTRLLITGKFVLSDAALKKLVLGLCPRLSHLHLNRCKEFATTTLIDICEKHTYLDEVYCSRQIFNKEMHALRLERPRLIPKRNRATAFEGTEYSLWQRRARRGQGPSPQSQYDILEPFCVYRFAGSLFRKVPANIPCDGS